MTTTPESYATASDSVRIAYQWLAAQDRITSCTRVRKPLKHIIEAWGGRYVSQDDVSAAARMLGLRGTYPCFDISGHLVWPSERRLSGIAEALTMMNYRESYNGKETYARTEEDHDQ